MSDYVVTVIVKNINMNAKELSYLPQVPGLQPQVVTSALAASFRLEELDGVAVGDTKRIRIDSDGFILSVF